MKSFLKIAVVFLLWLGIPSCFSHCPNHWKITEWNISFFESAKGTFVSGEVESDSLTLVLGYQYEEYAGIDFGLMNQACAIDCASFTELKKDYQSFEITSNNDFNETKAGEPLNEKLTLIDGSPVDSIIPNYFSKGAVPFWTNDIELVFLEKPDSSTHQFTIKITDWDGKEIVGESGEVTWK